MFFFMSARFLSRIANSDLKGSSLTTSLIRSDSAGIPREREPLPPLSAFALAIAIMFFAILKAPYFAFDAYVFRKPLNCLEELHLILCLGNETSFVDCLLYKSCFRHGNWNNGLCKGVTKNTLILMRCRIGRVATGGNVEIEKKPPRRKLVTVVAELVPIEYAPFEIKLRELNGCEYEICAIDCIQNYV